MLSYARLLLMAFFALVPTQVLSGPAEDAGAVFAHWKAAYDANDNVAVAKLYTTNAILHGTRSNNVTMGREAITKYFTVVVNTANKVEFREREVNGAQRLDGAGCRLTISCAASVAHSIPNPRVSRSSS